MSEPDPVWSLNPATDKVKVGQFIRMGLSIRGIVHVGANDGYEIQFYREMGIRHILCFEPLLEAFEKFHDKYGEIPGVLVKLCALANFDGNAEFRITQGDGQGSSLLDPLIQEADAPLHYVVEARRIVPVSRFDSLVLVHEIDPALYNCLVVDVQGMELPVLQGFGPYLSGFDMLCVECSDKPIYVGEVETQAVIDYVYRFGFKPVSPVSVTSDDVLFVRERMGYGL
jgi:FkbM family methyltransferase